MGEKTDRARSSWLSHFEGDCGGIVWGPPRHGDDYKVFPLLPEKPADGEERDYFSEYVSRCESNEIFCFCEDLVAPLLYEMLVARFDDGFSFNGDIGFRAFPGFEHYDWNAYSVESCREMCARLLDAADAMAGLSEDAGVRLTGTGEVAVASESLTDWTLTIPAAVAQDKCRRLADYLTRIIDIAAEQDCPIVFMGP